MVFGWPIAFAVALDLEPDAAMLGRVRVSAGSELIALRILFDRPLECDNAVGLGRFWQGEAIFNL
jgi:hypothetical protein